MQISSIAQPTEIQSTDFRVSDSRAVETVKTVKTDTPETSHQDKPEQSEKLQQLQSALSEHEISLNFSRDQDTNELVVKLVDDKTGQAIQQFPSEVSLKLAATFAKLQGQFVDQKF